MTDKELQKLGRRELLQLLLDQAKKAEQLDQQLTEATQRLNELEETYERLRVRLDNKDAQIRQLRATLQEEREKREVDLSEVGSIAEAALRLNGVFDAAQRAADQYLKELQERYPLPNAGLFLDELGEDDESFYDSAYGMDPAGQEFPPLPFEDRNGEDFSGGIDLNGTEPENGNLFEDAQMGLSPEFYTGAGYPETPSYGRDGFQMGHTGDNTYPGADVMPYAAPEGGYPTESWGGTAPGPISEGNGIPDVDLSAQGWPPAQLNEKPVSHLADSSLKRSPLRMRKQKEQDAFPPTFGWKQNQGN